MDQTNFNSIKWEECHSNIYFGNHTKDQDLYFIWTKTFGNPFQDNVSIIPYCKFSVVVDDNDNKSNSYKISYIDVPEQFRGKQIASNFLKAIEKKALENNITRLELDNDTDMDLKTGKQSTIYERAGYHWVYDLQIQEYNGDNILTASDPSMEKILPGGNHSEYCRLYCKTGMEKGEEQKIE
jgi:GNAT superfamily N-acetyltransferase